MIDLLHKLLDIPYIFIALLVIFSTVSMMSLLIFRVTDVISWILVILLCIYTLTLCVYWIYWHTRTSVKKDLELIDILRSKSYILAFTMELNLIMSVYYIYVWLRHRSPWFGTLAMFYVFLTAARFILLRAFDLENPSLREQYKKYVSMGYIMFAMMSALMTLTILAVRSHYVASYPKGTLMIVTAFSLFLITNATRGYFRHRHFKSPLLSACQLIAIAGALLGILSIQTVWLPIFSHDPLDVQQMNIVTGIAIFAVMLTMALYMIIHGNRVLKYGLDEEGNRIDMTQTDTEEIKELES